MTPAKQLFRHLPEDGSWGDCYRTAIACLLDLPPTDVPHVFDQGVGREGLAVMDAWLADRQLVKLSVAYPGETDLDQVLASIASMNPGVHHLLMGTSRTGVNHNVICRDGAIVHDPSLTDAGIVGPADDGMWWIEYLGARV